MNLFRKIGNIFMKMASRKVERLPQHIVKQNIDKIKVEPIRDMEDIVTTTKTSIGVPMRTRKQRKSKFETENKIVLLPKPASPFDKMVTIDRKELVESIKIPSEEADPSLVIDKVVKEKKSRKKTKPRLQKEEKAYERTIETEITGKLREFEILKPKKMLNSSTKPASITITDTTNTKASAKPSPIPSKVMAKTLKTPVGPKGPKSKVDGDEELDSDGQVFLGSRKGKRRPKDVQDSEIAKMERWEPDNWDLILENIRLMRLKEEAPVDTMGCDKCVDNTADQKTQRFHTLVALMLSSQTKDNITYEAMGRLKAHGLTPEKLLQLDIGRLENFIFPVSFYKNKAKYLKSASQILVDQYNSDIPNNIIDLVKLPGVGPKMAHICMNAAWGVITGIGVDVHVHRISNRLGWVRQETKDPEQTRKELESWLPTDRWSDVNHLLVGFGQTVCTSSKPKCGECLNKNICPSAGKISPRKPVKKEKVA